jgi:Xaa-Pro dipeptidase
LLIERSHLERLMESARLDALVATDPASVAALTGYRSWLDGQLREFMVRPGGSGDLIRSYAVFVPSKDSVLIVDPLFVLDAASTGLACWTHGDQERAALAGATNRWSSTAEVAIASVLREQGVSESDVGVEFEGMPPSWRELLGKESPRTLLRDCTALLRASRAVKSSIHIEQIRTTAQVSNRALAAALLLARPGCTLGELADAYASAASSATAIPDHFALSHGGRGIATRRDLKLTADTVSYLDHGCRSGLAVSDAGTTLRLRPLGPRESSAYAALYEAAGTGAELLAPGVRSSDAYGSMRQALTALPDAIPQGHGLGIEIREYPLLSTGGESRLSDECIDIDADLELAPGMIVNLEASLFGLGNASLHVELTYLVTDTGAEQLAPFEGADLQPP